MEQSIYHRLSSLLWGLIVGLIVLLAVYVSVGRMLMSMATAYQDEILRELNSRVPFHIDALKVGGEWHSFTPVIVLNGLRVTVPGSSEHYLDLSQGRVGLDVANSLRTGIPQMTRLRLEGLNLTGELTAQGRLSIRGFDRGDARLGDWLDNFLLNIERITLANAHLKLFLPGGEYRAIDLDLQLSREGSHRRVEATLLSNRGMKVFALAEGVGNPFKPDLFSGELYLNIETGDLGAVLQLLGERAPPVWIEGALRLELWSSWDEGEPAAEVRFDGRDLLVADRDRSRQAPLEHLAFAARLVERRNHWGLFVTDLMVQGSDASLEIPRLQLDAWGETVRLRAADIPLAPLASVLSGMDVSPSALELIRLLQPRGELSAVQVTVADINAAAEDWSVLANFEQVAVESWKGAPGVRNASGYLQLAPGGGFVVLDSQHFSMDFPTIYRQPLQYEDIHGTINMDWGDEALTLSSGLVTAVGVEGTARVLFGLNIPLVQSKVGIEMDLLVGLQNSHSIHRTKYIPYVLNQNLRNWLADSIGDGVVAQGGFLWRGSLRRKAAPLRTVQLFLNIEDTQLRYHPDWPALAELQGDLLIDDGNVSIWSDSARLYDSAIDRLSVEVWADEAGHLRLALDGSLQGPAADGLAVINSGPLGKFVGGAFDNWQLDGRLATDLALEIDLSDKSTRPQVEVKTRWHEVDLDIRPGNLPVRGLSGELSYGTVAGFSSRNLQGKLWGKPLVVSVGQQPVPGAAEHTADASAVLVNIAGAVDIVDVRQWLGLESLALGQGQSPVDVQVLVPPGGTPQLTIDSLLRGISLDLPSPWGKSTAADERQFRLTLPLTGDGLLLTLGLEGGLNLQLDMRDSTLRAGALAFEDQPVELVSGALRISGHTSLVDVDEWIRFVSEYFVGEPAVENDRRELDPPLAIIIDRLHTDSLVIGGKNLGDVAFDLAIAEGRLLVSARADWLHGNLLLNSGDSPSRLDISHLDLAGLDLLQTVGGAERDPLELPDLAVTITGLRQAERLLGNLEFDLRSEAEALIAQNITGEIAGLQLHAEDAAQLLWIQGAENRTELRAGLSFEDLGQTLSRFDYQRILETERGKFDLALQWPGAPQDFSLLQAQGALRVELGNGRFLDAPSGASGTLRVVSILNLAEILRRLSLSHMFEAGIPFDKVKGEVFFHAGSIEVPTMDVKGGSSSFQFSGVSDVARQTLDGELAVILPLANNLPWVAALTAGLPVAAGVFLLSKVFEKQVNRITSAVYRATGTWDDPEVRFDRIFDDSSQGPRSVATDAQQPVAPTDSEGNQP